MKKAIILCSGGLDSVVTAHYVKKSLKYDDLIILFFNYNQRTLKQEREKSIICSKEIGAEFKEIKLPELAEISTSLINSNKKAKKIKREELKDTKQESQNYYVPCRNSVFLIYALAVAEAEQIKNNKIYDIFTGFKNEGKEAYPDTTPEFVEEMNKLRKISTSVKGGIIAPLIKKDKEDIIKLGTKLGINFKNTYSCYIGGSNLHCGYCLSCRLRQEGFYWANIADSTEYKEKMKDFRKA
ncbi:MAG: 7-cyano-7-deazaguanine synthase [Candidatus Pacearchaeota archaeon]